MKREKTPRGLRDVAPRVGWKEKYLTAVWGTRMPQLLCSRFTAGSRKSASMPRQGKASLIAKRPAAVP